MGRCYHARRMPTTSQLVRKGRTPKSKKLSTPGLKSGKGRKKKEVEPGSSASFGFSLDEADVSSEQVA